MLYELISDADYNGLPDEPELKFVALEQICRRNLNAMISNDTTQSFDEVVRLQYMTTVASAAEELGIPGLPLPAFGTEDNTYDLTRNFILAASGVTTRMKLRTSSANRATSVKLAEGTRAKLEKQIQKLRTLVAAEAMDEAKRKALLKHLDDLSMELSQPRLNLGKVMVVLSAVGAALVGGTTLFAEGPHAIATITSLIGIDRQAEDAEALRLGAPVQRKALPAPTPEKRKPDVPSRFNAADLEDDIPF